MVEISQQSPVDNEMTDNCNELRKNKNGDKSIKLTSPSQQPKRKLGGSSLGGLSTESMVSILRYLG